MCKSLIDEDPDNSPPAKRCCQKDPCGGNHLCTAHRCPRMCSFPAGCNLQVRCVRMWGHKAAQPCLCPIHMTQEAAVIEGKTRWIARGVAESAEDYERRCRGINFRPGPIMRREREVAREATRSPGVSSRLVTLTPQGYVSSIAPAR